MNRVKIVTLVGSASQKKDFDEWNEKLTLKGYAVFSLGYFNPALKDEDEKTHPLKKLLCEVHKRKIEASDIIAYIPKPDGSLGGHARKEIEYAELLGKKIYCASRVEEIG